MRTISKGAEGFHAFGNFPNFALSSDGKFAAAVRSSYNTPPEVWVGLVGEWRQLTKNNASLPMTWGKAESIEWTNDGFNIQGWLVPPAKVESGKKYPMVVLIHGGPSERDHIGVAGRRRNVARDHRRLSHRAAITCCCRIRAAVTARAKISRAPT